MRPIGFSTGALAKGDFRRGLDLQRSGGSLRAVELSALRENELPSLATAVAGLDLAGFEYVSVHAPSKISHDAEQEVFSTLAALPAPWPIVVHPEIVRTPALWRSLEGRLCLENMDDRKTTGRTLAEMRQLFDAFPSAGFCLDLGHARQIDPTMATALHMLREFGPRLRQIHLSEVGDRGEHLPMSALALYAFQLVCNQVPDGTPIIIESVVDEDAIHSEARKAEQLFGSASCGERSMDAAVAMMAAAHA